MSTRTHETCCECGARTFRAGKGEDSLYDENDEGPYCQACYDELPSVKYSQTEGN